MHLFAYGTLMDPEKLAQVTGRAPGAPRPATLSGYRRRDTRFGYPVIFPAPGRRVRGVLWPDLTPEDLAALDDYEDTGEAYTREQVAVETAEGPVVAWVYVGILEFFRSALL